MDSVSHYNLRNSENLVLPFCRLENTRNSFFPTTIKEWNNLDATIKSSETLSKFKVNLRNKLGTVPDYYYHGERRYNIILTRLRNSCSNLNYDLFRFNITDNSTCDCGAPIENNYHFFFECPRYIEPRNTLYMNLHWIDQLDLNTILNGSELYDKNENMRICKEVLHFIKNTNRF